MLRLFLLWLLLVLLALSWNPPTSKTPPTRLPPKAESSPAHTCSACHQGERPPTHDSEFLSRGHGLASRWNSGNCGRCHQAASCDQCHQDKPPSWHSKPFRHPGKDPTSRLEHQRQAREHRSSCATCHRPRFQLQCGACHALEEVL
jgi:hypothetical protein